MKIARLTLVLIALTLLVACGGTAATPEDTTVTTVEEVAAPTAVAAATEATEPQPEATEPVVESTTLEDVQAATIRIQAQGSFIDPEIGEILNSAGQGSGFIIDPEGIAVTNNHVVTGAAFLEVYVPGDDSPRNARVLGVSECSDLAVIDIDGDGYPALAWYEGPINVGMEIYAAGFPLFGNEEYTLTRGIVSKAQADGESNWASVDNVLEVDATINPGNSGGPLVTADGQVVGVNYAGRSDTNQYFTISRDLAIPIVERLRSGEDVDSIGVNGQAINDGDSISGIWVSSVESGSPADRAGIESGDIITRMEGLILATDGTLADYCDILRSRDPSEVMAIEVLRFETAEVLEGQLNGDPLEQAFSFAQAVEEEAGDVGGGGDTSGTYQEYVGITDDFDSIYVEVPVEWGQVDGAPWEDEEGLLGGSIIAAPDIAGFTDTYGTPGLQIWASNQLGGGPMSELVDFFDFSGDCTLDGRYDYEDSKYTGAYDLYVDCGGVGSVIIVLAAEPADGSHAVIILGQAITEADLEAMDTVLDTFNVIGELPGS